MLQVKYAGPSFAERRLHLESGYIGSNLSDVLQPEISSPGGGGGGGEFLYLALLVSSFY
jgi:hypothetical protein